jgi:4-amino-4-deoxy-L-arabinose transferase-like glycosyltransferase
MRAQAIAGLSELGSKRLSLDAATAIRLGKAGVVVLALAYLAAFVVAAVLRLSYPFQLQVTEPASIREVERVLHGQPLYAAPTLNHVPMIYGPLYFYLSAVPSLIMGAGYAPLRLVSLLASMGSLTLIALLVRADTGNLAAGVIGAGLFAACYALSDTTLDTARVDALFVFFLLVGVCLSRAVTLRPAWAAPAALGSGIALAAAAFTKVPIAAAPVALAILLYLLAFARRRAVWYVTGLVIASGLLLAGLYVQSGPWATWYLWDLPRQHEPRSNLVDRFWWTDTLPRLTIPLLLGPLFLVGSALRRNPRPIVFHSLVACAMFGLAWASRTNPGGSWNVLLPSQAMAGMLFGLGVHEAGRQLEGGSARARLFTGYLLALCVVQFGLLAYNPRLTVPYRSDQWADEKLARTLAALPGQVFAPDLDGYLRPSDKGEQPMQGAVGELVATYGGKPTPSGVAWRSALDQALAERRFLEVVVVRDDCCLPAILTEHGYTNRGPLFPPGDEFYAWKTSRTPEVDVWTAP